MDIFCAFWVGKKIIIYLFMIIFSLGSSLWFMGELSARETYSTTPGAFYTLRSTLLYPPLPCYPPLPPCYLLLFFLSAVNNKPMSERGDSKRHREIERERDMKSADDYSPIYFVSFFAVFYPFLYLMFRGELRVGAGVGGCYLFIHWWSNRSSCC